MAPSQPTQTDSPLACGDLDSAVVRPSLTPGLLPKLLCWCLAGPLISCFWDCTRSVSLQLQLQHPVLQLQDLALQLKDLSLVPLLQLMGPGLQCDQLLGDLQLLFLTQL